MGDKRIQAARILDLPVVIMAVDRPEKIEAILPKLDEMVERASSPPTL